jgi:hypothetical protein
LVTTRPTLSSLLPAFGSPFIIPSEPCSRILSPEPPSAVLVQVVDVLPYVVVLVPVSPMPAVSVDFSLASSLARVQVLRCSFSPSRVPALPSLESPLALCATASTFRSSVPGVTARTCATASTFRWRFPVLGDDNLAGPVLVVSVTSNLGVLPLQLLVLASLVHAHPGLACLSVRCLE